MPTIFLALLRFMYLEAKIFANARWDCLLGKSNEKTQPRVS
jgi:hypothetical protein